MIEIPGHKNIDIRHIVFDYNGTIAKEGKLLESVKALFPQLAMRYTLHVVTADTFGSVKKELFGFDAHIKVLQSGNHTNEKAEFIKTLGADTCAAVGNGSNDMLMLKSAALSIAILGEEGCSKETLFNSDIVCKSITDAMELFLYDKRLIATLRR